MKHPIPDSALDDRLGFVGTTGSGKTYNAGGCIERLLDKGARVVVIDPLDVWWGLRLIADGISPSRYSMPIFGGAHGDLPLNEHAGALIGETVAGMAESCIVSLGGLQTKASERRFMLAFLDAIYRKANGEPVHLIFDEADLWAPQKSSEPMLQSRMEEICRRGRVKGLIPWLITQRPAVISKDVLSQVDGLVAFKLTSSQDRDALEGWIEGQADRAEWRAIRAQLPTMERGQGVVWIPARGIMETAAFPPKRTFDSSRTPKRGEKQRRANLQPVDLGKLKERLATVEAAVKADDPKKLRERIAVLERDNRVLEQERDSARSAGSDPQSIDLARRQGFKAGFDEAAYRGVVAFNTLRDQVRTTVGNFASSLDLNLAAEMVEFKTPADIPSGSPAAPAAAPTPRGAVPAAAPRKPSPAASGDASLSNPQRTLLRALAWWKAMGFDNPSRPQIAAIAGWKITAGHLKNVIGSLNSAGLTLSAGGHVALTSAGEAAAPDPDMSLTLVDGLRGILTNPQKQIFEVLLQARGPMSRATIAEAVGWDPNAGHLKNVIGSMRTLEIIDYPSSGVVELQTWVRS